MRKSANENEVMLWTLICLGKKQGKKKKPIGGMNRLKHYCRNVIIRMASPINKRQTKLIIY